MLSRWGRGARHRWATLVEMASLLLGLAGGGRTDSQKLGDSRLRTVPQN